MGEKRVRIFRGLGKDATMWVPIDIMMPDLRNKGGPISDIDQDGDLDIFTADERELQVPWCENPMKK